MTEKSWNARLRLERERLWPKQQGAGADALGIARETMSRYESGKVAPGLDVLTRLDASGIDVLYVITGRREPNASAPTPSSTGVMTRALQAPVRPDTTQIGAPLMGGFTVTDAGGLLALAASRQGPPLRLPVAFDGGRTHREYQVIRNFRGAASAGPQDARTVNADDMATDAAGVLAMDRSFMRAELGSDKTAYATVKVKGDSMERTLIDGETVIIDTDVKEVDADGIYVIQVGRNMLVKRLVLLPNGGLVVTSDNPAYRKYDVEHSPDQHDAIRVMGRMVWPRFR